MDAEDFHPGPEAPLTSVSRGPALPLQPQLPRVPEADINSLGVSTLGAVPAAKRSVSLHGLVLQSEWTVSRMATLTPWPRRNVWLKVAGLGQARYTFPTSL